MLCDPEMGARERLLDMHLRRARVFTAGRFLNAKMFPRVFVRLSLSWSLCLEAERRIFFFFYSSPPPPLFFPKYSVCVLRGRLSSVGFFLFLSHNLLSLDSCFYLCFVSQLTYFFFLSILCVYFAVILRLFFICFIFCFHLIHVFLSIFFSLN